MLFEWAYTYFTFTRGARLITGDQHLPGWTEQQGVVPIVTGRVDMTSPGAQHAMPSHESEHSASPVKSSLKHHACI